MKSSKQFWVITALLTIAASAFFCVVLPLIIQIRTARNTLIEWNLKPTFEQIHMLLSSVHKQPSNPDSHHYAPGIFFAPEIPYSRLLADGSITIAVYNSERPETHCTIVTNEHDSGPIIIRHIASFPAFTNALAQDDIVLYFGHGNFGRGIFFSEQEGGHGFFRMGKDRLRIPQEYIRPYDTVIADSSNGTAIVDGNCDDLNTLAMQSSSFWYMGCRTFPDYACVWKHAFPECLFVGSCYSWVSTAQCSTITQALIRCLQQRGTASKLLEYLNADLTWDILCGRRHEKLDFNDDGPYSPALLKATSE